ncbi:uncharacterized protein LOC135484331 [Lineus longissimus]|uniref:uncharacterized protein LOC135484331 n=1 Tax=Lineus longissimus TaxID=88925 RepID=UPI002B4C5AB7
MAAKYRDQFRKGDQSMESRNAFWNAGFQACVKCGTKEIEKDNVTCGARPNGEMYGTEIFKCSNMTCGWTTSFYYDDACIPWHYETKEWKRSVKFYTAGLMVLWAQKRFLPEDIVQKVKELNVSGETLLEWHQQGILAKKLDIPESRVEKLTKAIEARKTII